MRSRRRRASSSDRTRLLRRASRCEGFTRSQITVLRDGIWLGPANMVMRPQNTFNLDRVEVLRGPSSVLNGQGAVAGTVNAITKQAEPTTTTEWNALLSYGRFNTYLTSVGVNGPLSDSLWYRLDFSGYGSDGHVDRMSPSSSNLTGSLLWRPGQRAELKFSFDLLDDDVGSYFGTPLLPTAHVAETARRHHDDDRGRHRCTDALPQLQRGRRHQRLAPAPAPLGRGVPPERPGHAPQHAVRVRRGPGLAERRRLRLLHRRRRRVQAGRRGATVLWLLLARPRPAARGRPPVPRCAHADCRRREPGHDRLRSLRARLRTDARVPDQRAPGARRWRRPAEPGSPASTGSASCEASHRPTSIRGRSSSRTPWR